MPVEFSEAYDTALKELPPKWYESEQTRDWAAVLVMTILMFPWLISTTNALLKQQISESQIYTFQLSAIYFFTTMILDKVTTFKGFQVADSLHDAGSGQLIQDRHLELREVQTSGEYLKKSIRTSDLILLVLSFVPILGVAMGAERSLATLNNIRVTKRVKRVQELTG